MSTFESTFLPNKVPGGGFGMNSRGLFTATDTLRTDLDGGTIPQEIKDNFLLPTDSVVPSATGLAAVSDTGVSASDQITRFDNSEAAYGLQFIVQGTIPGAVVNVFADGTLIGTTLATDLQTTVLTNGTFDLTDGDHAITSTQMEPGKPESSSSVALIVTIDTVAPTPKINTLSTLDTTPPLSGTVDDATATLEVTIDGKMYVAANGGDGTWLLADGVITPSLKAGVDDVGIMATDIAGNSQLDTSTNEVTITGLLSIAKTADGTEGTSDGSFTITQSAASSTDTVVSLTVGGTATAGSDYVALPANITIPAGDTSVVVTVDVTNDLLVEATETVTVTLSSITPVIHRSPSTPATTTPRRISSTTTMPR